MQTKIKEISAANRAAHRQLMETVVEKCGAHGLAECEGPNKSILRFWSVNGSLVITQEFTNGDGWEYYLSGRKHKVAEIPADIQQATSDKTLADELLSAAKLAAPILDTILNGDGCTPTEDIDKALTALNAIIRKAEGCA